jgi:hypothetical protein
MGRGILDVRAKDTENNYALIDLLLVLTRTILTLQNPLKTLTKLGRAQAR